MKDFDSDKLIKEKIKVEINQEKEVEYKLEFDSRIIPHENHTLFEINIKTLEIKEAKFKLKDYVFNPKWVKGDKLSYHSEVIKNDGCTYVSALNKKSALKKYKQGLNGSKINPNKEYLNL